VQAASGPSPSTRGLQAPIRSVAAARRTGHLEGPGRWREAFEDETARVFIEFGSTRMVPARRRRELIGRYGRGKNHTLRLVAPFKEKRNAGGAVARKKAKITAGDLASNGKIPGTSPANLAGEASRYITRVLVNFPRNLGGIFGAEDFREDLIV